jgi:hypothetical protein
MMTTAEAMVMPSVRSENDMECGENSVIVSSEDKDRIKKIFGFVLRSASALLIVFIEKLLYNIL